MEQLVVTEHSATAGTPLNMLSFINVHITSAARYYKGDVGSAAERYVHPLIYLC